MAEILFAKKTDLDTDTANLAAHTANVANPHTVTAAQIGGAGIKTEYEAQADTNAYTDAEKTKLAGVETAATADQTGAEIKTAYQAEPNAYTDTKDTKLSGIEAAADVTDEANVTAALPVSDATSLVKDPADGTKQVRMDVGAVATATTRVLTMPDQNVDLTPGVTFQADLAVPSQAEAEAGTATTERVWTAQRVGQAAKKLSPYRPFSVTDTTDTQLAARSAGGSQIGATLSAVPIPTAGVIRVTPLEAEFDETGTVAAAEVAFALDVGATKVWAESGKTSGGAKEDFTIQINAGTTSRDINSGVDITNKGPWSATFDIVAGGFPTGAQDIKIFMGDRAVGTTGLAKLTGTTVTARILVEVIDTT